MGALVNLIGKKFGKLTVLFKVNRIGSTGLKKVYWYCKCDCGNYKTIYTNCLKFGGTQSCGCIHKSEKFREECSARSTRHGHAKDGKISPTSKSWSEMKQRCLNINNKRYKDWGGRGIIVCKRWLESFENFLTDMGEKPKGTSLDRINNNKGYYKENCRWATPKQQSNNTRRNNMLTYKGKTYSMSQWAIVLGMKQATLNYRFRKGYSSKKILCRGSFINQYGEK